MKKHVLVSLAIGSALLIPLVTFGDLTMPGYDSSSASSTAASASANASSTYGNLLQMPAALPGIQESVPSNFTTINNGLVGFLTYQDGPRVIKLEGSATAYWVSEANYKLPMLTEAVFKSYNNKWEDVAIVSQDELDHYPSSQYIRLMGKGVIYFVKNGIKQSIPSTIWNSLGADPKSIIDVNKTELNSYKTGKAVAKQSEITGDTSNDPVAAPVESPTQDLSSSNIDPSKLQWGN